MPSSASGARPTILYMSYDGLLEPLGESQVVAYLEILADAYAIHIVSFEKKHDIVRPGAMARMAARLSVAGIVWHPLRYHKRPRILSTVCDMTTAMLLAVVLALRHRARMLHARSVLCAAMLLPAKRLAGAKLLVDIRGFWVDERVDGGMIAPRGAVHRVLKQLEKTMLVEADHIVTLTRASVPHLRADARFGRSTAPITVIPTCADLARFSPAVSASAQRVLTIGYVGQIGTWYMLDAMLALFAAVQRRRPEARMLIVNRHQHGDIAHAVARSGVDPRTVDILAADHAAVPGHIRRMDAGLALISPVFSKIASAPTKLAEYLGCGVPVVGNAGCGDMAQIIVEDAVGVAMPDTRLETIEIAAAALLERLADPALAARCVASARRHFALEAGAERYRAIYRALTGAA